MKAPRPSRCGRFGVVVACFLALVCGAANAQQTIKREIDVGFASMDVVRPVVEAAMSPQGRFVMLAGSGSIMLIDTPAGVLSVEQAVAAASANLPKPDVALNFRFQTGLAPRRSSISVHREVPFPTRYQAPTIIVGPNGPVAVIPATPTEFERRNIGDSSETVTTVNPDGSLTVDINTESTSFEGFINYGSAILPNGVVGTVPVANPVGNPQFFNPFINSGDILVPIIGTTRISTSVVIRPRLAGGVVALDMMPRLVVEADEDNGATEDVVVNLPQFQTALDVRDGEVGRVYGFANAPEEFNRRFFNAKPGDRDGEVAIIIKAELKPPGTAAAEGAAAEDTPGREVESEER